MTAFPNPAYDGQVYTIGPRSWTYNLSQNAWILNKNGPTGPAGPLGPTGPAGVLLTSLIVDTFTGDGITTSFTLSITPVSIYNMIVNVDGLVQTANTNYTLSNNNIIFTTAPINNATIDVMHFLTGSAITGPPGYPGPTGPAGGPTGPTGPSNVSSIASALVNAGTFVTLDNIKATVTTGGNRGLSIAAVATSFNAMIFGTYGYTGGGGGNSEVGTITTTPSSSQFSWNFSSQGDGAIFIITDTTNNLTYRIIMQIGASYNNNFISIERLL
jgi:hypothetical protein